MSTSLSKKQKKQRNKEETHMEEGTHQSKSGEKETKTEKRKGILPFFFKQLKKKTEKATQFTDTHKQRIGKRKKPNYYKYNNPTEPTRNWKERSVQTLETDKSIVK